MGRVVFVPSWDDTLRGRERERAACIANADVRGYTYVCVYMRIYITVYVRVYTVRRRNAAPLVAFCALRKFVWRAAWLTRSAPNCASLFPRTAVEPAVELRKLAQMKIFDGRLKSVVGVARCSEWKMVETYGARESCTLIRRQVETEMYVSCTDVRAHARLYTTVLHDRSTSIVHGVYNMDQLSKE